MKASDSNKKFFLFKLVIGDELIQLEDSSEEGVDNINTTTKSFWFNGKYLKVQIFEKHTENLDRENTSVILESCMHMCILCSVNYNL